MLHGHRILFSAGPRSRRSHMKLYVAHSNILRQVWSRWKNLPTCRPVAGDPIGLTLRLPDRSGVQWSPAADCTQEHLYIAKDAIKNVLGCNQLPETSEDFNWGSIIQEQSPFFSNDLLSDALRVHEVVKYALGIFIITSLMTVAEFKAYLFGISSIMRK